MSRAPLPDPADARIGVLGLGYVGLPLAVEFGKHFPTLGFDINAPRVSALQVGHDHTGEVGPGELAAAPQLVLTTEAELLRECNVFVVTVPTPIDAAKRPDLGPLLAASRTVGAVLKRGDVVVFESTVYPGCTEEDCQPVLEAVSGLRANVDFSLGYSPERINPGDPDRRLPDIRKVTSGSNPDAATFVDALYSRIIRAGTYAASSIKVAEAAKVIENTQRDVNIALVNELAMLFNRLGIDTHEVLAAAGTKWNFLPFKPGLVGGHCIGVDPYYLTHKAQQVGHHPDVILAGRRINDGMGAYVAGELIKLMARHGCNPVGARVLVLGLAFKENCPDLRNTRVVDILAELRAYGVRFDVHDPWADACEAEAEYGLTLCAEPAEGAYDAVLLAVAHRQFIAAGGALRRYLREGGVVYDAKGALPREAVNGRL